MIKRYVLFGVVVIAGFTILFGIKSAITDFNTTNIFIDSLAFGFFPSLEEVAGNGLGFISHGIAFGLFFCWVLYDFIRDGRVGTNLVGDPWFIYGLLHVFSFLGWVIIGLFILCESRYVLLILIPVSIIGLLGFAHK